MNSAVNKQRFNSWISKEAPAKPFLLLIRVFGCLWLFYDVIDLFFQQARIEIEVGGFPIPTKYIFLCQLFLIFSEVGMVLRPQVSFFILIAFLARLAEIWFFPVNDFCFYCVIAFILFQFSFKSKGDKKSVNLWPRDILVLEMAWIYFCSALLKLGPHFFSGGDLYVRNNYIANIVPIHYPSSYFDLISSLSNNSLFSKLGLGAEFFLSIALAGWLVFSRHRKPLRALIIALALAIHGYAMVFLNVIFFGFSIVLLAILVTGDLSEFAENRHNR
jgi:hypothetical protein